MLLLYWKLANTAILQVAETLLLFWKLGHTFPSQKLGNIAVLLELRKAHALQDTQKHFFANVNLATLLSYWRLGNIAWLQETWHRCLSNGSLAILLLNRKLGNSAAPLESWQHFCFNGNLTIIFRFDVGTKTQVICRNRNKKTKNTSWGWQGIFYDSARALGH